MTKITLNNVASLIDATTAANTINANSSVIQTAFDNTLSRDGTQPNVMNSPFDMNGNPILNLPPPSSVTSPARLVDIVSNPTIVVPGTGTSGHAVPFLDGNNTWSGSNTFSGLTTTPVFTSTLSGSAPASGGGTINFLRADGTWVPPAHVSFMASLGANVVLNNTANFFDGPSVAQGSVGTWWVSGTVTFLDTTTAATFYAKLWDGTTVISSSAFTTAGINIVGALTLSGFIVAPAGNLRISCRDIGTVNGLILANTTGLSKDSTISAIRIA